MIPILFDKSATTFTTNGLGRLSDCISCLVTEERNGIYELEIEYPVTGVNFDQIQVGQIIVSTHDEAGDLQPFDIYMISQPIDGIVTVYAHHISYRLNEIVVQPFTATTCATAIAGLKTNSIGTNSFTFSTDKTVTADYKVSAPASLRGLLGGEENSLLDVYGTGEYKFDNFAVSLLTNRGSDTDVSIRYGKNLIDFNNEVDHSDVYNAVVPYWLGQEYDDSTGESSDTLVMLSEKYIASNNQLPNGRTVYVPLDLSSEFEEQPTEAQLRTLATSKLADSNGWLPSQNIKVDFIQLWQTEEYAAYTPLQKVSLCDTVLVSVPMYNIANLRIKVIKVIWNALLDRYDEMELGTPQATFASVIESNVDTKYDSTQNELNLLREVLSGQIDAKIETWTMSSNPAADWTTQELRDQHNGDLWLYTGTTEITIGGVTIHPQGTYQYNSASGKWAAYSSTSSNLFDLVDGKTTIFYGTNTGTYANVQVGDYLVDSTNGKTYRWNGSAWVLLLDYKTYTNNAKTTSTEVQYCLSNSNSSFVAYGSWSTTLPEYVAGKYYWMRTVTYYGDGTSSTSTPRLYQTGQTAAETQIALESTNNHFWYDNTGAYVTEDDGTYSTGYATRITNAGILQSYNGNTMSSWTNSGVDFYESGGTGVTIAEFGSTEARIGKSADRNVTITSDAVEIKDGNITKASFGEDVIIGRPGEYHTSIEDDSFGISSGYEQVFDISNSTRTKQITATDVSKPLVSLDSTSRYSRHGSLWIKLSTTYTFVLYTRGGDPWVTETFNTDTDGTAATTKSFTALDGANGTNTVNLVFTPSIDGSGNQGMMCDWTQNFEAGWSTGYLLKFTVKHTATINVPVMSFVGDIDLTDGAVYKSNGKAIDYVVERGTDYELDWEINDWHYDKWASGKVEAWGIIKYTDLTYSSSGGLYRTGTLSALIPSGIFPATPTHVHAFIQVLPAVTVSVLAGSLSATNVTTQVWKTTSASNTLNIHYHCVYYPQNYSNAY